MLSFIGVLMCSAAIMGFATGDTCVGGQCPEESSDETALLQGRIKMDEDTANAPADEESISDASLLKDWHMSLLASWVYDNPMMSDPVSAQNEGWKRHIHTVLKTAGGGEDRMVVYTRGKVCVLAFSGSDDDHDWKENFNDTTAEGCGVEMHAGFWAEYIQTVHSNPWKNEFVPFLNSEHCDEIYVTGHSKGGAQASVFAHCANRGDLPEPSVKVDELYTFGAPATAKTALTDNGAAFKGKRFYTMDEDGAHDSVPPGLEKKGFVHPVIEAVDLRKGHSGMFSFVSENRHPASEAKTPSRPEITPEIKDKGSMMLHMPSAYGDRLLHTAQKKGGINFCADETGCTVVRQSTDKFGYHLPGVADAAVKTVAGAADAAVKTAVGAADAVVKTAAGAADAAKTMVGSK